MDILKSTRSDDPEVQNSLESIAAAVSLGWAKNAMNTRFLSGPARLIEAVDDPDRYGKAWVRGFAGSFMPGAARDIEKLWSPEKKDIQGIMDLYKSKIPGYSEELPRMRNRWGDVIKVDNRFLSNETQTSPIDNELIRIRGDLPKPRREQVFEINGRRASMPVELTPHQLVEVLACGLCHTDLGFADGSVPTKHPLPLVLGHEAVGTVVASGPGAEALAGTPVIVPAVLPCGKCTFCLSGRGNACPDQKMPGNDIDGGFATHMIVPAAPLVPLTGCPAAWTCASCPSSQTP